MYPHGGGGIITPFYSSKLLSIMLTNKIKYWIIFLGAKLPTSLFVLHSLTHSIKCFRLPYTIQNNGFFGKSV